MLYPITQNMEQRGGGVIDIHLEDMSAAGS